MAPYIPVIRPDRHIAGPSNKIRISSRATRQHPAPLMPPPSRHHAAPTVVGPNDAFSATRPAELVITTTSCGHAGPRSR